MSVAEVGIRAGSASPEQAFALARQLLQQHFAGRIKFAYVDDEAASDRVYPVVVVAEVSVSAFYNLQKELADAVFGPIALKTRLRMPFQLVSTEEEDAEQPTGRIVVLYGKVGS